MAKPGKVGAARIIDAMKYSQQGLRAQWQHEAAFRQEVLLLLLAIPLAIWLGDSRLEQVLMIFSASLVVIVETLN